MTNNYGKAQTLGAMRAQKRLWKKWSRKVLQRNNAEKPVVIKSRK